MRCLCVTALKKLESIKKCCNFSKWYECLKRKLGTNKTQMIFIESSSALKQKTTLEESLYDEMKRTWGRKITKWNHAVLSLTTHTYTSVKKKSCILKTWMKTTPERL